jgi:hypothetical protein
MKRIFTVGERVTWNSEAGQVGGTIIEVHTQQVNHQGLSRNASVDDPQYSIQSDHSDALVMHKGSALTLGSTRG